MKHTVTKTSDKNDDAKKRKKPSRNSRMQVFFRELCFFLVFVLTTYAALSKNNFKIRKSPPAAPFLVDPNINDFFKGDLSQLMHDVSAATYSFIFFYAPWDADSQDLKSEFLETAEFYKDKVYFAGVNCWEPGSECRGRFNNVVERYPQLVAYVGLERAVEYRGPHKADHMIKFLHSVINPLERLNSVADLSRVRHLHGAALVGFLNIHGTSDFGLTLLYETSLSLASRDHVRQIAIGVFTNTRSNSALNVTVTPTFHLYIWDKKFVYEGVLKRSALLKWVVESSSGMLMSTDGLLLLKPPVVVMFSPLHPLALLTHNYLMFQRVAMSVIHNVTTANVKNKNLSFVEHNTGLQQIYYREMAERENNMRRICNKRRMSPGTCTALPKWQNLTCKVLPKVRSVSLEEDRKRIANEWRDEVCRLAERTPPLPLTIPPAAKVQPLNSSFTFACLDSSRFQHLARALGIDILSEPSSTMVIIIGDEEMVKMGRGEVKEDRLWTGLSEWAQGRRKRFTTESKDRLSAAAVPSPGRVHLPDLGLRSFSQLLRQGNKHSLILYYSQYCGACAGGSHTLLEMSQLLAGAKCLFLSRVDGDRVDLPWHYSLHFYPSLLFLPAVRKSESRLFPADAKWSFSAISQFLLANLAVEERPEVMLALCVRWGNHPEESEEGDRCIQETRKLVLSGIDRKLSESRHWLNKRKGTLQSLAFLRAVYLMLARVVNIEETLVAVRRLSSHYGLGCTRS